MATAQMLSSLKYSDSLTVVGISFCTAVVYECISWFLIYPTNSYKSLKFSINKASKKLETMKTENPTKISNKKSKTKKIDRVETSLKESSRDLSLFKFKFGAVVALVLFVVFGLLNSLFEGKVVGSWPNCCLSWVFSTTWGCCCRRIVPHGRPQDQLIRVQLASVWSAVCVADSSRKSELPWLLDDQDVNITDMEEVQEHVSKKRGLTKMKTLAMEGLVELKSKTKLISLLQINFGSHLLFRL
ncbi:hypothetical protein Q3G72_021377 [Acer saccharum]|nr:hypothetical protein Q3G72_021377 [Acer saccharum]